MTRGRPRWRILSDPGPWLLKYIIPLNCAKRGALWPDTSPKRRGFYRRHRSGADRRKRFQAERAGPHSGLRRGPRPHQYVTPARLARIGGACAEPCAGGVRCGYCGPAPQSTRTTSVMHGSSTLWPVALERTPVISQPLGTSLRHLAL